MVSRHQQHPARDAQASELRRTIPALQALHSFLGAEGISSERAQDAATRVHAFWESLSESPFRRSPRTALLTGSDEAYGNLDLWLWLLWPVNLSLMAPQQSRTMNELSRRFAHEVSLPLRPILFAHLEFVSPGTIASASLEAAAQEFSSREHLQYLGVLEHQNALVTPSVKR